MDINKINIDDELWVIVVKEIVTNGVESAVLDIEKLRITQINLHEDPEYHSIGGASSSGELMFGTIHEVFEDYNSARDDVLRRYKEALDYLATSVSKFLERDEQVK